MIQRHCFGMIPLQEMEGLFYVLLVHHKKGHWAFPKGHSELEETPQQTAIRELKEETGLHVIDLLPLNPLEESYVFTEEGKEIEKTVTYFFAKVGGELKLQQEEILEAGWYPFEQAKERITFAEGRALCDLAKEAVSHLKEI